MKKQLLSTSAIALGVAMAAPASAQDWNVDWGGYMSAHVAFVDVGGINTVGTDYDGLSTFVTGEIIFHPSVTLDNGLTFGVNVQMEAQNNNTANGNNIDESYVQISGDSLGTILIGAENSAGYKSMVGAPTVTSMWINSASISALMPISFGVPFNFRQAGISSYTEVAGNDDVTRLTYFTPDFNGLTLGVSYARNNSGNADQGFIFSPTNAGFIAASVDNSGATLEDIYDIGAYYSGTFGTTSLTLGARYGSGSGVAPGSPDAETWGIGAQVGFGAVTIGASYTENDNGNGVYGFDQTGWSLGATYDAPGPWAFELLTYQGNYENTGGAGIDSEYQAYRLGASRDIGPGVDWDLYAIFAEATMDGAPGTLVDGTIIGTALNLSF